MAIANRGNLELIEQYYQQWQRDPASLDEKWQAFFEGFELGGHLPSGQTGAEQTSVVRLIYGYRDLGHFQAHLDPLNPPPGPHPLLSLERFGLSEADLDREFDGSAFHGLKLITLRGLLAALNETYCSTVGIEYLHIQDTNIREWLKERIEPRRMRPDLPLRQKFRVLTTLLHAELFEKFLHTRYQGQKRFSLEGAETLIPVLDAIVEKAPSLGVKEIVFGMAHRGRLNVLANILCKPYEELFAEFEDNFLPNSIDGDGDVKYHLGFSSDYKTSRGEVIHLSLTPNPSHLEAVNPVVAGRTRAKQEAFGDGGRTHGVPLLIHGDAAFAGQGIVAETLNLCDLAGFTTGGTVHVIVNNQIGFTTAPTDARSTTYCTDVAKMIQAPIFHVNAEDPEAAVFIAELALEFRQKFSRDVIIDLYCYRKHGHNEGDEPSFTQPLLYEKIKNHPGVSDVYTQMLVKRGDIQPAEAAALQNDFQTLLGAKQKEVHDGPPRKRSTFNFNGVWKGLRIHWSPNGQPTGASRDQLKKIAEQLLNVPDGFNVHSKIARLLEGRRSDLQKDQPVEWAVAEALAFGSLIMDGNRVRFSGQDSRRGTFSQRHAVLTDVKTGARYVPLGSLKPDTESFAIYDSMLSEAAVLGFEWGYSLDAPNTLVLWEAQFGDFVNGAQTIIDQFIVCSESKWQRSSGLVLLLPHGYEGQGPEHSTGRLERFLQACAENNIQVANLSTPAQYFHALRRQIKRDFRKPLVVMTPKSLLRHKDCRSPLEQLVSGHFEEVLDDPNVQPERVKRVLLCSGKIYYDLSEKRAERKIDNVAIVRLEQIYPFPEDRLRQVFDRYKTAREWVWVQEESQNMGGWSFVEPRLREMHKTFEYVGRDASSSPATGQLRTHKREQAELVDAALSSPVPHVVGTIREGANASKSTPQRV
ncbi:MAG: 2-oxoglutarate dehydrogenase E1 component [Planctomycetes bacterium]|nr:2-oxoglutarate dehydrogenase E1 component [Planctomycetota bacterium]